MFSFKKKYFLIIQSIKDIDLSIIKKHNKFVIIYRNLKKKDNPQDLLRFRKRCKLRSIKFVVANDYQLAVFLKSDGVYLPAHNKKFKSLNLKRLNFEIIGSAHNISEIVQKKKQGCRKIILSKLFLVSYKQNDSFLEINKFNNYTLTHSGLIPLGGINMNNLNKLKLVNCEGFALLSEIKKKPANIINRLF